MWRQLLLWRKRLRFRLRPLLLWRKRLRLRQRLRVRRRARIRPSLSLGLRRIHMLLQLLLLQLLLQSLLLRLLLQWRKRLQLILQLLMWRKRLLRLPPSLCLKNLCRSLRRAFRRLRFRLRRAQWQKWVLVAMRAQWQKCLRMGRRLALRKQEYWRSKAWGKLLRLIGMVGA